MKKLITLALALITVSSALADVRVGGYFRSNGTYVQPHFRSSPNSTVIDNWSFKGNVNPYTGKIGTRSYRVGW